MRGRTPAGRAASSGHLSDPTYRAAEGHGASSVLLCLCALAAAAARAEEPAGAFPLHDELIDETAAEEETAGAPPGREGDRLSSADAKAFATARLETFEARLESLEEKLDRIDELLRLLFASRLRRVELLARNEELGRAIPAVEERYSIRNVAEALTEDDTEKLGGLRKRLAGAAAATGVVEFAADPDVVAVLAAMAERREFLARHGRTFLAGVVGRDRGALSGLVLALLERDSPGATEAALWAAPRAGAGPAPSGASKRPGAGPAPSGAPKPPGAAGDDGAPLPARLSEFAREVDREDPRLYALAQAAAASHGDADAAERLVRTVKEGELTGAFAHGLAGELASAGSKVALHVYLELLRDEQYAFAASQAFNRIHGFERRVGWREVRENRDGLYEEFAGWLARNYDKLHYEPALRRFTVE